MKKLYICLMMTPTILMSADIPAKKKPSELILKSGDQEFVISKAVTEKFSTTLKDIVEDCPQLDCPLPLHAIEPEYLQLAVNLMNKADEILIDKPTSEKGSYVELSKLEPLKGLNGEQLVKLATVGDFLGFDVLQKAVALRIAQLVNAGAINDKEILTAMTEPLDLRRTVMPYIAQQYYLLTDNVPNLWEPYSQGISLNDLFVHNKAPVIVKGKLNLSNKRLKGLDGLNQIAGIKGLKYLDVNGNQLTSLPDLNLPNLLWLVASDNRLTMLPDLYNLPMLRRLRVKNNQLTALPDLNLPNLEELNIINNRLIALPNLNNLSKLRTLKVNNNSLTKEAIAAIEEIKRTNKRLNIFGLDEQQAQTED